MGGENTAADPDAVSSKITTQPNSGKVEQVIAEGSGEKEATSTSASKASEPIFEGPEDSEMDTEVDQEHINDAEFIDQNYDNFDDEFDTYEQQVSSSNPLSYSLATSPNTPLWAKIILPILCLSCHVIFFYGQTAPMWKLRTFAEIDVWANATDVRMTLLYRGY